MAAWGASAVAWLRGAFGRGRPSWPAWRPVASRRALAQPARAWLQRAVLALGRELTARGAPLELAYAWLVGAWVAQSMAVAARLEIADRLKAGPKTCEELAAETGAHGPSLYRLMRALAGIGLFSEDAERRFRTTRFGRCLESDAPDTIHPLALMIGSSWHWQSWGSLYDTVRTGEAAFGRVMGAEAYAYFEQHPADGELFSAHIHAYARRAALAAATYDFAAVGAAGCTIVDVGGGYGTVIVEVLRAHPRTRAVLFDLPDAVEGARAHLRAAGLAERCALVAGSFFDGVPTGGDVYLLASIIHNWDDERAIAILARCRAAMADAARLLLVELVIPPGNAPADGKLLDLQMMVLFAGGRERTPREYQSLLEAAGFRLTRVVPTPYQMNVIEARPAAGRPDQEAGGRPTP